MEEGEIQVDSIDPIGFPDITPESHQDHSQANFIPQSMAEWHRGAVGGKLSTRPAGPHCCAE
jgi:hypothetical protein